MTELTDFELLPSAVQMDGAFLLGMLAPGARRKLIPIPVKVDGWTTIALCIKAKPPGEDRLILHPVAIVPHARMNIIDNRKGQDPKPAIRRVPIRPAERDLARMMLEAADNPNAFFSNQE